MPDQEEIDNLHKLLKTHRRTLAHYRVQMARYGSAFVPAHVAHGIDEARDAIQRIKADLRGWGIVVEDLPGDEPDASATEQAGAGLTAMAMLMSAPDIRAEVAAFQEHFGAACRQIELLSTYKMLHDLLHDLQFKCYRPIISGARDFPNNDLFLESLSYHESDLQQIVNNLWELVERPDFPASEQVWIKQLAQASELLAGAIQELSRQQLDRAMFQIERVLNIHPTRINERLKDAARDLPLATLIKAMSAVHDHLAPSGENPDRLRQISEGILALEQIRENLARLIHEHDTWQMYDPALRQFEDRPDQHAQQIEWLWQDLKPVVLSLCDGRADRWSEDLRLASQRLDRALAAQTVAGLAGSFHTFHSRFSLCFFRVDKELKEQCLKLRLVDGPLRAVAGMIG